MESLLMSICITKRVLASESTFFFKLRIEGTRISDSLRVASMIVYMYDYKLYEVLILNL